MLGGAAEGLQGFEARQPQGNWCSLPPPQPPPQMLREIGWREPFAGSKHTKTYI